MPLISDEDRAHVDIGPTRGGEHPHRPRARVPVQLPRETLRELSRIDPWRSLSAVGAEWAAIALAIALAELYPVVTPLAVLVIGARQHALMVIGHDAAHYRFLPNRRLNDLVAEVLVAWPVFMSARFFRVPHAPHHQHLGAEGDGNRRAWGTHDAQGRLKPEWTYPRSPAALLLKLARRTAVVTGLFWIVRFFVAPLALRRPVWEVLAQYGYHGLIAAGITAAGWWPEVLLYWLLPYCTWHITAQYVRLICEHSGPISDDPDFAGTRSTHPGWLGRFFVLPRHIGYHIEHHWYPSVPWYNLPALYEALRADPAFERHANVQTSVLASLGQCIRPRD